MSIAEIAPEVFPDAPLFIADFQRAATDQQSHPKIGTRLYRDLMFRGTYYDLAVRLNGGEKLTTDDRLRLRSLPETVLSIHYFGELTNDPQAMSLNGLCEVVKTGAVDDMIVARIQRSDLRERILGQVIADKMHEVVLTTY